MPAEQEDSKDPNTRSSQPPCSKTRCPAARTQANQPENTTTDLWNWHTALLKQASLTAGEIHAASAWPWRSICHEKINPLHFPSKVTKAFAQTAEGCCCCQTPDPSGGFIFRLHPSALLPAAEEGSSCCPAGADLCTPHKAALLQSKARSWHQQCNK